MSQFRNFLALIELKVCMYVVEVIFQFSICLRANPMLPDIEMGLPTFIN